MTSASARDSSESPLFGAVVCFTSVPPEQKTRFADYAQQLGAEHKLDLTSDVTHLLVGSTDTPKYHYVAREREDVKVLRPDFIEVIRKHWMEDRRIDLVALESEYRLPTLAGLKICITGFDDLSFRAQLQQNVIENGGEYTGDLTKDVTHLIAAKPVGKKYEYGMQWQKKVVSLQWYKDTLARGMQLDESLYHPMLPAERQGQGAWHRQVKPVEQTKKRSRDEVNAPGPARKIRRTASARLGSQNSNLWGDIVGEGSGGTHNHAEPSIRSVKSMPVMRQQQNPSKAAVLPQTESLDNGQEADDSAVRGGFFHRRFFIIDGFDSTKANILKGILIQNGATVLQNQSPLCEQEELSRADAFLLLPYQIPSSKILDAQQLDPRPTIVTELWIERCMMQKKFIPPETYALGQSIHDARLSTLENLVFNASGFVGLETLHISKVIKSMGGRYDQFFNEKVSILICNESNINHEKLRHAREWHIPVVSENWLWSCIRESRKIPIEKHLLQAWRNQIKVENDDEQPGKAKHNNHVGFEKIDSRHDHREGAQPVATSPKPFNENEAGLKKTMSLADSSNSSYNDLQQPSKVDILPRSPKTARQQSSHDQRGIQASVSRGLPLHELSPNLRTKQIPSSNQSNRSHTQGSENERNDVNVVVNNRYTSLSEDMNLKKDISHMPKNTEQLDGEIRDLLNIKAKAHQRKNEVKRDTPKKKLFGRALSNLSNCSATSHVRSSRASSVDSMNTDGIGSEILPVLSNKDGSDERASGTMRSYTFTGRATTKWPTLKNTSTEPNDSGQVQDGFEEAETPQLTQLTYEDPEEAIQLRRKLAEKRHARTRLGPHIEDSQPPKQKEVRKLRDNDMLANAGWGAKGRTRHKGTSIAVGAEL